MMDRLELMLRCLLDLPVPALVAAQDQVAADAARIDRLDRRKR